VDQNQQQKLPHSQSADEDWDRWDDGLTEVVVGAASAKPNSVEDHIRAYRTMLSSISEKSHENFSPTETTVIGATMSPLEMEIN